MDKDPQSWNVARGLGWALVGYGEFLERQGRPTEAEPHYRRAWEMVGPFLRDNPLVHERKLFYTAYSDWVSLLVREGRSSEALALADRVVELTDGEKAAYQARGALRVRLGQHAEARRDFTAAMAAAAANDQADWYERYLEALCCLGAQDSTASRSACAEMLNRYGQSQNTDELRWTAWTCSLAPGAVEDYAPVRELADRNAQAHPSDRGVLQTLGAVLYRAGQFEAAHQALTKADTAPPTDKVSPACAWFFLAMTNHQLGQDSEAHAWFDKATTFTKVDFGSDSVGSKSLKWYRRLTLELLQSEAAAMLARSSTDSH